MALESHNKFLEKANKYLANNRLEDALGVYKELCAFDKNNPDLWVTAGSLAGRLGKFAEAEIAFRKALDLQTSNPTTADYLAQALEAQGKYGDAIEILLQNRKDNLSNKNIFLRLGVLYGKSGNFRESVNWLKKLTRLKPNHAHAHHCLASAYESLELSDQASLEYRKAIELKPSDSQLHNNYGAFLQKTGNWNIAIKHYNEAIRLNPQYTTAFHNLASALYAQGEYSQAITHYSHAIKLKPDYTEAYVGLGRSYRSTGETNLAIRCYEKALSLDSKCIAAYANMGRALVTRGRNNEALTAYKTAIKLDPGNIDVTCAITALHERRSEYQQAYEVIKQLLDTAPYNTHVAIAYGAISRKLGTRDIAISNLSNSLLNKSSSPRDKSDVHYMLGKLHDEMGNYDTAFKHFHAANELMHYNFDRDRMNDSLEQLIRTFSRALFPTYARSGNPSRKPVFIVGMPRSGTTLVEQIIASHPGAYGAGELLHIPELASSLQQRLGSRADYPESIGQLTASLLSEISSDYIRLATEPQPDCKRFTDKMPHNFIFLGLIELLFPNATIIHCTRNPIDTCLSIYFSSFAATHAYASSLENVAAYYTDYYQKIMSHWKSVISLPIMEVNYEDLVENQEAVTRRLVEYCGLEWNEICLRFHETGRDVSTISYDQVRQPIYKRSRGRWKNYRKHILPLTEHFFGRQSP